MFNTALDKIFGVKKYADVLINIVESRNIKLNFKINVIEVRPDSMEAVFEVLGAPEKTLETYKVGVTFRTTSSGLFFFCKTSW